MNVVGDVRDANKLEPLQSIDNRSNSLLIRRPVELLRRGWACYSVEPCSYVDRMQEYLGVAFAGAFAVAFEAARLRGLACAVDEAMVYCSVAPALSGFKLFIRCKHSGSYVRPRSTAQRSVHGRYVDIGASQQTLPTETPYGTSYRNSH